MSEARSKWIRGNLVFYNDTRENKWLDAVGPTVRKHILDTIAPNLASSLLTGYANTAVEAGSGSSIHLHVNTPGGAIQWFAAANEDDGLQSQSNEAFKLESGKPLYFGADIALLEKTQSDAFIGLATTDTAILASIPDDLIGFITHDGDANLDYQVRKDGTGDAVDTGVDLVDATFVTVEFYFDGTSVYVYVADALIATVTANIPDDTELAVSIAYLNGTAQASKGLNVKNLRVIQIG